MIEIRGLCKRFGKKVVLDGLDLTVPRGENMVVIGGSGTGKSVLLKCVVGLMRPDEGEIRIDGEDITRMAEEELVRVRRRFGMLFQASDLFDSMDVGDNVGFALRRRRKYPEERIRGDGFQRVEHGAHCGMAQP